MIITRLLSGILFICGPRSIICTLAPLGRKNDATRATIKQYALQKSSYCPIDFCQFEVVIMSPCRYGMRVVSPEEEDFYFYNYALKDCQQ